jgi:two-component system nitrate/nitrite response regulator NarL
MKKLKILLIDDHALFREGLLRLFSREEDFEVVGSVGRIDECFSLLEKSEVDLILLDYDLGSESAIDFFDDMQRRNIVARTLILTAGVAGSDSVKLIEKGAAGIFHKHNTPEKLCDIIRNLAKGEVWLEQTYLRPIFNKLDATQVASPVLTDRERQVLRKVVQGLATKEIAHRLKLSETSIKGTLQQLFNKTGVRTRSQLVRVALEQFRDQI